MQFTRRPDLDPQTRIKIVNLAWLYQGVYGKMTKIAQQYQISRTFLYRLLLMATVQLETLFSDEKRLMQNAHRHFAHLLFLLRLEGHCSLLSMAAILQALDYHPHSVGFLSQFFHKAGQALPSTLLRPSQTWVFYLSDEIFALDKPILITIDARRTTILNIELAPDRSAETWQAHFAALEQSITSCAPQPANKAQALAQRQEDLHFHDILASANPNQLLRFMCQVINHLLRLGVAMGDHANHPAAQKLGDTNVAAHRRLLAAARRRDSKRVRKLMVEHIDEAERHVRKLAAVVRQRFVLDSELRSPIAPRFGLDNKEKAR